jgi:hypothetical protein
MKYSQGNYDYSADGKVTITDFNLLATNFGKRVPPPTTSAAIATSTPRADIFLDSPTLPDLLGDADLL